MAIDALQKVYSSPRLLPCQLHGRNLSLVQRLVAAEPVMEGLPLLMGMTLFGVPLIAIPACPRNLVPINGSDSCLEGFGLVGLLPGEVIALATEVAIRRRLAVDGALQVEHIDEALGPQVEMLAHQFFDP